MTRVGDDIDDDLRGLLSHDDLSPASGAPIHQRLGNGSGASDDDDADGKRYGTFGQHKRSFSVGSVGARHDGDPESALSTSSTTSTAFRAPPPNRKAVTRQTALSLAYCLGGFAMGNALGWSSPALPRLESPESSPQLTPSEAGWVGSLVCLGALLQGPATGYLMTRLGRRCAVVLACLPCLCGWLLIATATEVWMLYAGRLMTGWAAGAFSVVAPVYIGEVAAPQVRGSLGSVFQLMVVCGIFSMYLAGIGVSWQNLALAGAVVPAVLFAVALAFLRDSPASYMSRGRPELARKCLVYLRNSADIGDELYAVQRAVEESRRSRSLRAANVLCAADPAVRRPTALAVFLMFAQQLSGVNTVIVFAADVFAAAHAALEPSTAAAVVGAVLVAATALSPAVNSRAGRRPVLVATFAVMAAALAAFGAHSYLRQYKPSAADTLDFLPLLAMALFIVSFSVGPGPLAWLMMGELLPPRAVGAAGGLASIANWSLAFLVTACFGWLTDALGSYGTYWLFAFCCTASAFLTFKFLPETRNKTLREVQESFTRR